MSYILDALRKSESERQQGRIPDLGQQVQLIHRPRKPGIPVSVWVALALCLNAAILGVIFWPDIVGYAAPGTDNAALVSVEPAPADVAAVAADKASQPVAADEADTQQTQQSPQASSAAAVTESAPQASPEAVGGDDVRGQDRPTVIVPSPDRAINPAIAAAEYGPDSGSGERTPHLVELPMSFQRKVPTLIFNSHVYASDPAARRVIINDHYLRIGDTFSGIRIDRITEDGVELSMDGQRFRVGVVRDWISPR